MRARKTLIGVVVLCLGALSLVGSASGRGSRDKALHDLYFGEALYYARQGHFFDALERLDAELGQHRALDEPELDSLYYHLHDAEFSVGDFELNYRMHHRAGHAITAVLEGAVDEQVRNDAAYRLARIHFQKDQLETRSRRSSGFRERFPKAFATTSSSCVRTSS